MGLKGKRILLISPEPWEHIAVSKHHYARTLAERGNEVYFLGPPEKGYGVQAAETPGLHIMNHPGWPPGMRFLPKRWRRKRTLKEFERLEQLADVHFDLLWSFDNSVFFEMAALPDRTVRVSHIVDLSMDAELKRAAFTADICFCTTPYIERELLKWNPNVHRIGHGYAPSSTHNGGDVRLPGDRRYKAVYAGNLDIPYLDRMLLERVARNFDELDLILLGPHSKDDPYGEELERLLDRSNVHWLGSVPSQELEAYLSTADLLLLTYREGFEDQVANPHKMMAYLGSGTPVVATYTACYEGYEPLIRMAGRNEEFLDLLEDTLERIDHFGSEELRAERRKMAMGASYEERIKQIEGHLIPIMEEKGLLS